MKTYRIEDREAGNVIEKGLTLTQAKKMLKQFEYEDKVFGIFEAYFYEIVEE